jgi:AsmA protein
MKVWIWRLLVAAILVCAGLAGILLLWVDPDSFKDQIIASVRENTGREVTITGKMDLEFFPYLAVSLDNLEMGNPAGFEGPFLTLRKAHLKARLLPLLSSRLEVVAVDVEGLSLFLTRDAQGLGNWQDLAGGGETSTGEKGDAGLAKDRRVPLLASLIVDGLVVSDTSVVWLDERSGERVHVSGIGIDVSDFAFGQEFDVDTRAVVTARGVTAELDFAAKAVLDLDRLSASNLVMKARISGDGLPDSPETLQVSADYFSTSGRLDNGRLRGLGLDARVSMREGADATTLGNVDIASFSPRDVFRRLGISLADLVQQTALEKMSFTCEWVGSGDRLDVSGLHLVLDNSTLQGDVRVQGPGKPAVGFNLKADTLDLNRYLSRPGQDGKGAPTAADGSSPRSMVALRGLDLNGTLAVDALSVAGLRFSNTRAAIRAKDGLLGVERLDTEAYGGRLNASASMDVRSDIPAYTWSHSLTGLQLGPFLRDLHGSEALSGTAQASASLQARGQTEAALKRSLGGSIDFKVVDGAVHGVNIAQRMRDEILRLKGQAAGPNEPNRTEFSVLSGSGVITGGVETTRDLLMIAPRFRITGDGQANLVREDLDFRLTIFLEGSQGRFEEASLGFNSFPVRVTGPMRAPSVSPDMESVLKGLGIRGGQAIGETLRGVGSGVNKGVEGLKRLFQ